MTITFQLVLSESPTDQLTVFFPPIMDLKEAITYSSICTNTDEVICHESNLGHALTKCSHVIKSAISTPTNTV